MGSDKISKLALDWQSRDSHVAKVRAGVKRHSNFEENFITICESLNLSGQKSFVTRRQYIAVSINRTTPCKFRNNNWILSCSPSTKIESFGKALVADVSSRLIPACGVRAWRQYRMPKLKFLIWKSFKLLKNSTFFATKRIVSWIFKYSQKRISIMNCYFPKKNHFKPFVFFSRKKYDFHHKNRKLTATSVNCDATYKK